MDRCTVNFTHVVKLHYLYVYLECAILENFDVTNEQYSLFYSIWVPDDMRCHL